MLLKSSKRHRADQQVQEAFVKEQQVHDHQVQEAFVKEQLVQETFVKEQQVQDQVQDQQMQDQQVQEAFVKEQQVQNQQVQDQQVKDQRFSSGGQQEQGMSPGCKDFQGQELQEGGCQGGQENFQQMKEADHTREQISTQGRGSSETVDNNNCDVAVNNNCGGADTYKDEEGLKSCPISPETKLSFGKLTTHHEEPKVSRGKADFEEEEDEAEVEGKTWRDEFDDDLDEDLIGDEEDRKRMDALTEKEREEEIFR